MALQLPAHNQTLELNHRMGQPVITSPLSMSAPKFFGSFFQKRTLSLLFLPAFYAFLMRRGGKPYRFLTPLSGTPSHSQSKPEEECVLDVVFIVLGAGGILLMIAYADFCARI